MQLVEERLASNDLLTLWLRLLLSISLALDVTLLFPSSTTDHSGSVWVQAEQSSAVAQRVLLLGVWALRL